MYSQKGRHPEAFRLMLHAAEAGHAAAQHNTGLSYLHGLGVKQDNRQAFDWFEKAARQDLPDAQSELAMLYYLGKGVEKNITAAQNLWHLAAAQNDEYAQFNLASLLLELGRKQQAIDWFKKAEDNHHPRAKAALEALNVVGDRDVE